MVFDGYAEPEKTSQHEMLSSNTYHHLRLLRVAPI